MNRFEKAREALESFDDIARMGGIEAIGAIGAYKILKEFIEYAEGLETFIEDAMEMHSNLDIDVEIVRRIRDNKPPKTKYIMDGKGFPND